MKHCVGLQCLNAHLFVSQRVDDGNVATQCRQKYSESRGDQHDPERPFREPEATEELIMNAVVVQPCDVGGVGVGGHNEQRSKHVYHALVDDQNTHDLNRTKTSFSSCLACDGITA